MKGLALLRRFLIGIVFVCVVVAPFNDDILQLLFIAVICTGGVSLIVIVPAFGLVGWLLEASFLLARSRFKGSPREAAVTPPPIPPSRQCLALAGYLRDAGRAGMTDAETVALLSRQGWSEQEIRSAREHI